MTSVTPGVYRHFKGRLYRVIGTARHSETEEEHVVYSPLDGEGELWVRPRAMWDERVERGDYAGQRFAPVDPADVATDR